MMQEENKESNLQNKGLSVSFILATLCSLPFLILVCINTLADFPVAPRLFGWQILGIIGVVGIISSGYTAKKRPSLSIISIFYILIIVGFMIWVLASFVDLEETG